MASQGPSTLVREMLLKMFHQDAKPLPIAEIRAGLDAFTPGQIAPRLSELVHQGLVESPSRGVYHMPRDGTPVDGPAASVAAFLADALPPEALGQTVVWDATHYLDAAHDGAPGTRMVLEAQGHRESSLANVLVERGPATPGIEVFHSRSMLVSALAGHVVLPLRAGEPALFIGPSERRLAGTALTEQGYRVPRPERVLVDFLGGFGSVSVDVVRALITQQDESVQIERLQAVADERNAWADVQALCVAAYHDMPAGLRQAVASRIPDAAVAFLEER